MIQAPNTTPYPNDILDRLMPLLSGAEFKVLSLVVRQTFGWHREWSGGRYTSLAAIVEGCGVTRPTAIAAARALSDPGGWAILEKRQGKEGAEYRVRVASEALAEGVKKLDQGESNNFTPLVKPLYPLSIYEKKKPLKASRASAGATAPAEEKPSTWAPFFAALVAHRGGVWDGGRVYAWMGQTSRAFGDACGRDVGAACSWLDRWMADPDTRNALAGGYLTDANCAKRAAQWLRVKGPKRSTAVLPESAPSGPLAIGAVVRYDGLMYTVTRGLDAREAEIVGRVGLENGGLTDMGELRRWRAEVRALVGSGALVASEAA